MFAPAYPDTPGTWPMPGQSKALPAFLFTWFYGLLVHSDGYIYVQNIYWGYKARFWRLTAWGRPHARLLSTVQVKEDSWHLASKDSVGHGCGLCFLPFAYTFCSACAHLPVHIYLCTYDCLQWYEAGRKWGISQQLQPCDLGTLSFSQMYS